MSSQVPGSGGGEQDTTVSDSEIDVLGEAEGEDTDTVVPDTADESEGETTDEESETEEDTSTETETDEETEETIEDEEVSEDIEDLEDEEEFDEAQITRPSWSEIKQKYPELAKNQEFREIYMRDAQFSELFPSIAEAKTASAKAEAIDILEADLASGDVSKVLKNIDEGSLLKVSRKFLPSLYQVNPKAFTEATRPLIVDMLNTVLEHGQNSKDENLVKSVRNISRALYNSPDVPKRIPIADESPEVQAEKDKLRQERYTLYKQQEGRFLVSTDKFIMGEITKLVTRQADPHNKLNPFVRKAVIASSVRDIKNKLGSDEAFNGRLQNLFRLAAKSGFPNTYKSRLISASLDRAKRLIPVLVNKHKMAALGRQQSGGSDNKKIVAGSGTGKVTTTTSGKGVRARDIDMKRTSPEDFLHDRVTLRK